MKSPRDNKSKNLKTIPLKRSTTVSEVPIVDSTKSLMKINTDKTSGITITKNVVIQVKRYVNRHAHYKQQTKTADDNLKEKQATIDSLQATIDSLKQEKSHLECELETERAIKADLQAKQSDIEAVRKSAEDRVKESKINFLKRFEQEKQKIERKLQEDYSKKLSDVSGEIESQFRQKLHEELEKERKLLQEQFEKDVTSFKMEIQQQNQKLGEYAANFEAEDIEEVTTIQDSTGRSEISVSSQAFVVASTTKSEFALDNSSHRQNVETMSTTKRQKTGHVEARSVSPIQPTQEIQYSDPEVKEAISLVREQNEEIKASPMYAFKKLSPSERKNQPKAFMMTEEGKNCETYEVIQESLTSRKGTLNGASSLFMTEETIVNMNETFEEIAVVTPPIGGTAPQLGEESVIKVFNLKLGNFNCKEGTMVAKRLCKLNGDMSKHLGLYNNEVGFGILNRILSMLKYDFLTRDEKMRKLIETLTPQQKADPELVSLLTENSKLIATMKSDTKYVLEKVYKPMLKGLKQRGVTLGFLQDFSTGKADRFGIDSSDFITVLQEVLGHDPCLVETKHLAHGLMAKTLDDDSLSEFTEAIKVEFHFTAEATVEDYSKEVVEEYLNEGVAMSTTDQLLSRLSIQPEARDDEHNYTISQRGMGTMERNAKSNNMTLKEALQSRAKKGQDTKKAKAEAMGMTFKESLQSIAKKGNEKRKASTDSKTVYYCYPNGNVCETSFGKLCEMIAKDHGSEFMDNGVVNKERLREKVQKCKISSYFAKVCNDGPWVATSNEMCLEKKKRGEVEIGQKISDAKKASTDSKTVYYCYPNGNVCETTFGKLCEMIAKDHGSEFMDNGVVNKESIREKVRQYKKSSCFTQVCNDGPVVATSNEMCLKKYQHRWGEKKA